MISRLIEASPDGNSDLYRGSGGISKYKERRRENRKIAFRSYQEQSERPGAMCAPSSRRQLSTWSGKRLPLKSTKPSSKKRASPKKPSLPCCAGNTLKPLSCQSWQLGRIRDTELQLRKSTLTGRIRLDTALENLRAEHQQRNDQLRHTQAAYYEAGGRYRRGLKTKLAEQPRGTVAVRASLEVDQALASETRGWPVNWKQDNGKLATRLTKRTGNGLSQSRKRV